MKLGEVIQRHLDKTGLSQRQFAIKCGLSSGYVSMLVAGVNPQSGRPLTPTIKTYDVLARQMNMTLDELFDMIDDAPVSLRKSRDVEIVDIQSLQHHKIPVIGSVAGGEPIYDEETDLYIEGSTKASCAVRLKGDSMEPTFMDGDIIYVQAQPDVHDGQIAIVFLEDEAVLKRVYHITGGVQLLSDNPKYKPIIATSEIYNSIRILGIPCGFTRMFNGKTVNVFR